ncbi:MAG: hypothetical protein JST38_06205 [Bacteroidetes bacterium]|nr:hypothetical protein [Bacteroidota bacterium]MBS1940449.1 hypothetical protein [Bacteroidota bacterium]
MGEGEKSNLEELKNNFPTLDNVSAGKLLGGGVLNWGGELPHIDPGWTGDPFGSGGNLHSYVVHGGGGGHHGGTGGGGSSYFGDDGGWDDGGWDDGGWDDSGWGDDGHGGGWGDYDDGTDSNPGGSGGGNGQDSSGNPGGHHIYFNWNWDDIPEWSNVGVTDPHTWTVRNNTNHSIWVKPEHTQPYGVPNVVEIPPGGTYNGGIDGFKINGIVIKITDGYGWVDISDTEFVTNYLSIGDYWNQLLGGGVLFSPPWDHAYPEDYDLSSWQDLFDAS